jgi:hypothetical protein
LTCCTCEPCGPGSSRSIGWCVFVDNACTGPFGSTGGVVVSSSTGVAVRSGRGLNDPVRFGDGVVAAPAIDLRARAGRVDAAFFATVLRAVVFVVAAFFAGVFFVADVFAAVFFAGVRFAVDFRVALFFVALFFAAAFFAVPLLADAFFAAVFFFVAARFVVAVRVDFFAVADRPAAVAFFVVFCAGARPAAVFVADVRAADFFVVVLRVAPVRRVRAEVEGRVGDMAGSWWTSHATAPRAR